jgi:aryl-alcohol dehydrogenase-like predicted oxidoreductase
MSTVAWTAEPPTKPIPKRPLGKTGYQVTIYGLGGLFTLAMHDRHDEAVEIVNRAIDLGVNYIDTSALEVFLASKSHDYTYDGTVALVQQSLRRQQTDYLDLYQHHFLGELGHLEQLEQNNSGP